MNNVQPIMSNNVQSNKHIWECGIWHILVSSIFSYLFLSLRIYHLAFGKSDFYKCRASLLANYKRDNYIMQ